MIFKVTNFSTKIITVKETEEIIVSLEALNFLRFLAETESNKIGIDCIKDNNLLYIKLQDVIINCLFEGVEFKRHHCTQIIFKSLKTPMKYAFKEIKENSGRYNAIKI